MNLALRRGSFVSLAFCSVERIEEGAICTQYDGLYLQHIAAFLFGAVAVFGEEDGCFCSA